MKFFTSHTLTLKKTVRLFQYFTSLTLWMHGVLHQSALQQQPLYKPPSMNVSGIYTALAMQTILYNESRGANLYSVTQNRCLPTDKLALTVTSNGEENKIKKTKPECFLIGSLGDDVKGAALVMQVCSKTWDFYNGYICFCKTYCKDTQFDGKLCKPVHKEQRVWFWCSCTVGWHLYCWCYYQDYAT